MAAAAPSSDVTANSSDGPVLSLINKRLRALRKKLNRILQMEDSLAQGKPLNKEQEDVLRSKPAVSALIDELEKLRQPLASAVSEEISLAVHHQHSVSADDATVQDQEKVAVEKDNRPEPDHAAVEDLLNLLYFGSLFDVKSQSDFTSTVLTRTHERGCCLTYDYVTDDETVPLGERDLDLISMLGGLLISRPVNSSLSHKNALQRCIQHAKLWLANSEQPIEPDASVTYAELRERLSKILVSDYYTTTPEMKATVEVAAAAAAGNYAPFQVPVPGLPVAVPLQVEVSAGQYLQKDEETTSYHEQETGDDQSGPAEDFQKDEPETDNHEEFVLAQQEQGKLLTEMEQNQKDIEHREQQYVPRRPYQNHRGGRGGGGGRRAYSNGRGGRGGRGGGSYQNGRSQYYDQSGNYYPRNHHNNRGRGGRGGGHAYNHHGSGLQGGHAATDVGVAS